MRVQYESLTSPNDPRDQASPMVAISTEQVCNEKLESLGNPWIY